MSEAELLAVGSRDHKKAHRFADRFDVPRPYERYDRLLADQDIDVVYVATPNYRHRDDCLECLDAGKAVLCEKPFALSAAETKEVVDSARDKRLFCMEAMWMRFIPAMLEARRRIESGEIGEVRLLKADLGHPTPFDPDSRYYSKQLGGGCLLDRGVYLVSLAHYLIGTPCAITSCGVIGETGVDYQSAYLLEFENGVIADLSTSLETLGTNEAIVFGTKGRIRIHDPFYRSWALTVDHFREAASDTAGAENRGLKQRLKTSLGRYPVFHRVHQRLHVLVKSVSPGGTISVPYSGNGYQFELSEVTRCVQGGQQESPLMTLDDTLAVMRTMDAIRRPWQMRYPQDPVDF